MRGYKGSVRPNLRAIGRALKEQSKVLKEIT